MPWTGNLENGFQRVIYQRALAIEMRLQGDFSREHEMEIVCKGENIDLRKVDFFVEGEVMAELKAIVSKIKMIKLYLSNSI